jgi:hypothetical protein
MTINEVKVKIRSAKSKANVFIKIAGATKGFERRNWNE